MPNLLPNFAGRGDSSWTPTTAGTAADSGVLSAVPCHLVGIQCVSAQSSAFWLMIFDATALPVNGTAPRLPAVLVAAGAGSGMQGSWDVEPLRFARGLVWAASSTQATLTATAITAAVVAADVRLS